MKDTFYFSHDYNTRSDIKIKKLIAKHGYFGYGVFWGIIEDLYQNSNNMQLDYSIMSYDFRTTEEIVKSIINDFDLFVIENNYFGSISIQKRLYERNEKSKKARDNANKRWGECDSRIKAKNCIFYIIKLYDENESFLKCGLTTESISRRYSGKTENYKYEIINQLECSVENALDLENLISGICEKYNPKIKFSGYLECYNIADLEIIKDVVLQRECKGIAKTENSNAIKESKVNESKVNEIENPFEIFRKLYPGTKRGLETELNNFKKHKDWLPNFNKLLPSLQKEIEYKQKKKNKGEFVPEWKNLQTWINNRCWEQEFEDTIKVYEKPKMVY